MKTKYARCLCAPRKKAARKFTQREMHGNAQELGANSSFAAPCDAMANAILPL